VFVLANAKKHAPSRTVALDPCSSAPEFTGFREPIPRAPPNPSTSNARTWLLAAGWKRHGLISVHETPRGSTPKVVKEVTSLDRAQIKVTCATPVADDPRQHSTPPSAEAAAPARQGNAPQS
jgi:hypothetical protein